MIEIGDVVQNIENNTVMTISEVNLPFVKTQWFVNRTLMEDIFGVNKLRIIDLKDVIFELILNSSFDSSEYPNYSTIREYLYAISSSMFCLGPEDGYSVMAKDSLYWDVYKSFIKNGYIDGQLDEYGHIDKYNDQEASELLSNIFKYLFKIN